MYLHGDATVCSVSQHQILEQKFRDLQLSTTIVTKLSL